MRASPLLAFALFALTLLFAIPGQAMDYGALGGRGDASANDVCPPGNYVVGYISREGAWVDFFQVLCAPFDPVTRTLGAPFRLDGHGGPGGQPGTALCTAQSTTVVGGLTYALSDRPTRLLRVRAECITVGPTFLSSSACAHPQNGTCSVAADTEWYRTDRCPYGEAVIGIDLRYGKDVNAIGINCGPAPGKIPAPVSSGNGNILSCSQRPFLKTPRNGRQVTVQFHNAGGAPRQLQWIDPKGKGIPYPMIPAGGTVGINTFQYHIWELTDVNGVCTLMYQAGSNNENVEVR